MPHNVSLPPAPAKKRRNPPQPKGGNPSTVTKRRNSLALKFKPPALDPLQPGESLGPQHEDTILAGIESGLLVSEIAQQLGVTQSWLARYLNDPSRQGKTRESRRLSAIYWDEQAQRTIEELPSNATPAECLRARELASHFRWRAKAIAPHDYGDRPTLDAEAEAQRQAQALTTDAARMVLGGILAAIGLQVSELPKDRAGRIIDHDSST